MIKLSGIFIGKVIEIPQRFSLSLSLWSWVRSRASNTRRIIKRNRSAHQSCSFFPLQVRTHEICASHSHLESKHFRQREKREIERAIHLTLSLELILSFDYMYPPMALQTQCCVHVYMYKQLYCSLIVLVSQNTEKEKGRNWKKNELTVGGFCKANKGSFLSTFLFTLKKSRLG